MQTQDIQHDRVRPMLNGNGELPDGVRKIMDRAEAKDPAPKRDTSVIGADIVITGNIEASVDLHIEGKVIGDVRCATLILGESSSVNGHIYAARVKVSGTVEGAIATRDLAVEATARVTGDISYERLRVANGGMIEGNVSRRAPEAGDEPTPLKLVEGRDPLMDPGEKTVIE
jgi:cytoskeletal protein CcmA (bactofilin family)